MSLCSRAHTHPIAFQSTHVGADNQYKYGVFKHQQGMNLQRAFVPQ